MQKPLAVLTFVLLALVVACGGAAEPAPASPSTATSAEVAQTRGTPVGWEKAPAIVVLFSRDSDPRIALVNEAVSYWNERFKELGSPFRLGTVSLVEGQMPDGYLPQVSVAVADGPGSLRPGQFPLPDFVVALSGEIVVILSDEDFVSFSITPQIPGRPRTSYVAIKSEQKLPMTLPNVARNVIAHELGHSIGLMHNSDPTKLMCGRPASCRPDSFSSPESKYFPLTDADKGNLLRMYPPSWKVAP